MVKLLMCVSLVLLLMTVLAMVVPAQAKAAEEPKIVHNVFFTLNDNSAEARKKLVQACKKHLSKHPGTLYFSAGSRGEDFKREANDRDWDVGLHVVFTNKAAHDRYQKDPRHVQFIEENQANWKKVRVFDSTVSD